MPAGLTPSIGTVGDALDNAPAKTTIGLGTRNEACMKPASLHSLERPVSPCFAPKDLHIACLAQV
jgi:hypothetical protein